MGIEPTTSRASDPSTALKAVGENPQAARQQGITETATARWRTHWWNTLRSHPELADLLTAWPELPETIRADIVAMVEAVVVVQDDRPDQGESA